MWFLLLLLKGSIGSTPHFSSFLPNYTKCPQKGCVYLLSSVFFLLSSQLCHPHCRTEAASLKAISDFRLATQWQLFSPRLELSAIFDSWSRLLQNRFFFSLLDTPGCPPTVLVTTSQILQIHPPCPEPQDTLTVLVASPGLMALCPPVPDESQLYVLAQTSCLNCTLVWPAA